MNETQSKLKTLQDSFNELLDENKNLKVKIHEKSNEIYDIQNSEVYKFKIQIYIYIYIHIIFNYNLYLFL